MRKIIWGMSNHMQSYIDRKALYKKDEIIAFIDNNSMYWGKSYLDIPILSPWELVNLDFDQIIICAASDRSIGAIREQLTEQLGIDASKITTVQEIDRYYTEKVIEKYRNHPDDEIQAEISFYKEKGLSVFGSYQPDIIEHEVYRDAQRHPYIMYGEKKFYYPDSYRFFQRDKKEYLIELPEQKEHSPHLYIKDENIIYPGAVLVDAGACEGNFAIRFVDRLSKLYLIESDPEWVKCLKRTFLPYKDKTIICEKALARYDSADTVTLDSLLDGQKIDFLKMDIEGAEIDALLGAKKILSKNNVNCSICSYHKMGDEENIRLILEALGYRTSVSEGYMFFWFDENICDTLDLRKGIVYANKRNKAN